MEPDQAISYNYPFRSALMTQLFTMQNTSYIASPRLFHPAHVVSWPSFRHCRVGTVVAADGADVGVSALRVCEHAEFLNPPTHCALFASCSLMVSDFKGLQR